MDADSMASAADAERAEQTQMWRRNTYTRSSPRQMRSLWRSQPSQAAAHILHATHAVFLF